MMLVTIGLIYVVLILNQAANKLIPGPEEKALPQGAVEERFAAGLSWTMDITLKDKRLQVQLRDDGGRGVKEGKGTLKLLDKDGKVSNWVAMKELHSGLYTAELPEKGHGVLDAQVEITTKNGRMMREIAIRF